MKKEHFDILFLDHMMPEMDGIETLKKLQEASLINDTVVIALTANAVLGAREQYLNTGFDNYLSKPINVNDLEDILIRYLKPDPVTDQETEKAPAPANDTDKLSASSPRVIETVKDEENGVYAEFVPYNGKLPSEEDTMENNSNGFKNNTASVMDKLQELGISTKDALMYCGGDESFYIEILDDYSSGAEDKIKKLTAFLEANNLKDYKILVHSVKSSSKTIGAMQRTLKQPLPMKMLTT